MRAGVTGGTGFVGTALLNLLASRGWSVTALARDRKKIPTDVSLDIVDGDLDDPAALRTLVANADVVFHLAGVTHAQTVAEFDHVNRVGAATVMAAAAAAGGKMVHISSLSAREPHLSPYAQSKRDSEIAVREAAGANPWLALRLPAIYGPGDFATLPYFKLIKSGLALEPRTKTSAKASLLHVDDAARAILAAASAPAGKIYEVGDDNPEGRSWREIGAILGQTLDTNPRPLRVPKGLVSAFHAISRKIDRVRNVRPNVRPGQANEFFHPDWVARNNLLSASTDWRAEIPIAEGFAKTAIWYQDNGLL